MRPFRFVQAIVMLLAVSMIPELSRFMTVSGAFIAGALMIQSFRAEAR